MSRIGTGFRKWSFSRPRRLVTTSPASWSTRRCFITPKRLIGMRASSALSDWPSSRCSSSSNPRRVGSASALNTSSTGPAYVTFWSPVKRNIVSGARTPQASRGGVGMGRIFVTEFISLDGVMEDPGGAEGYRHGGWSFAFDRGADGDAYKLEETMESDGLLLGRRTFEGFAAA